MSGSERDIRQGYRGNRGKLRNRPTRLFLHKYALAIGWPVPLLEQILTGRDIAEAMAYDKIEPYGDRRADFRNGILASLIANVNRPKNGKVFAPVDFMPEFGKKETPQDNAVVQQIKEIFKNGNTS